MVTRVSLHSQSPTPSSSSAIAPAETMATSICPRERGRLAQEGTELGVRARQVDGEHRHVDAVATTEILGELVQRLAVPGTTTRAVPRRASSAAMARPTPALAPTTSALIGASHRRSPGEAASRSVRLHESSGDDLALLDGPVEQELGRRRR